MDYREEGFKPMTLNPSSEAAKKVKTDIRERKDGLRFGVTTKYPKLDKAIRADWNRLYVIGAMSGAGKSVTAKDLCDSIEEHNDFDPLFIYQNTEMISSDTFKRSLVTRAGMTLSEVDSEDDKLTDKQLEYLNGVIDELSGRENLFYVDEIVTPEMIIESLRYYYLNKCREHDKPLVYIMDHSLLMASSDSLRSDKEKIDYLAIELIKLKKDIENDGGKCLFYVLSQLNRDIQKEGRIKDPTMHRPIPSDMFASSFLEQGADALITVHVPAKLGIDNYTAAGMPAWINVNGEPVMMAYMDVIKNRHGQAGLTIPLFNKLKYFSYDEMDNELWKYIYSEHQNNGICNLNYD